MSVQPRARRSRTPDVKTQLAAAVEAARDEILDLSHRIHANPEPAFEERQAAAWVADTLARHGYDVEHPAGRLETAVRADPHRWPRRQIATDRDPRRVRRPPGLGHGCGHNTMAASGVGAAIALAAVARRLPGEIVFLGTPAEERGSGKQIMIDDGLFDGIDAALHVPPVRPEPRRDRHPLASEDVDVIFTACRRTPPPIPWKGRNALDAMIALFVVGRPVAPAAAAQRPASTGSSRRVAPPRTSSRTGRGPGSCSEAAGPGLLRRDEGALPGDWRGAAALATGATVEVGVLGRRDDDAPEPDARRALGRQRRGATGFGTRAWTEASGSTGHGQRDRGSARPSTPSCRSPTRGRRPHRSLFRDAAAHAARRRDDPAGGDARRPDGLRAVRRPDARSSAWREFRDGRASCIGRPPPVPGRGRARYACRAARPAGRRTRTGGAPARRRSIGGTAADPSVSGDLVAERPHDADPRPSTISPRATAGTASTRRTPTSTCPPTSARRRS